MIFNTNYNYVSAVAATNAAIVFVSNSYTRNYSIIASAKNLLFLLLREQILVVNYL